MILITGGLGFIGTATVEALLDCGEECVLLQRSLTAAPEGRFTKPVTVVQGDVKDLEALREIGHRYPISGIVHLAGSMPWPADPDLSAVEDARRSLGGLFNLVQAAEEWGVQRVSLASTIGVYGGQPQTGALGEDLPLAMTSPHPIPTSRAWSATSRPTTASISATSRTPAGPSPCCSWPAR